ncbi:unnamed protein product [Amoebophrya sp. A25]|nr:unnamed protein product [Amoebophrya sp. A25]|eukprot:GSA25T00025962001.1
MGLPLLICGAVLQLVHIVKRSMHQVEPPTAGTTQLPMLSAIDTANVVADGNVTAAAVVTRTASASCRGENASTSATAASPCNASGNGACLSLLERGDSAGAASAMHGTNGAANRTSSFNSAAGIKPNLMITEADNVEVDHAVQVTSNYNIASKNTSDNSTGRTVDVIAEVIMPGPQLESDAIAANWTDKNHNEAWDSEVEKADPLTEEQREFFTEALNMEAKMNPEASKPMATLFVSTTATEETQETKPEANISMNLGGNLTASSAAAANPVLQKALGTDPNGVMSVALSPVPQEEEATRTFTGTNGSAVNFTTSAQVREAIEKATAETYVDLGVSHVQPITFSTVDLAAASPSMLMLQEEEKRPDRRAGA